jgi:23S rRNA pseudouridine2604 synthase
MAWDAPWDLGWVMRELILLSGLAIHSSKLIITVLVVARHQDGEFIRIYAPKSAPTSNYFDANNLLEIPCIIHPEMTDQPEIEKIRLSKLMSQRGLCSRREADKYIEQGLVSVDGEIVDVLGTKVLPDAEVFLQAKAQRAQDDKVTVLINKPIGYVSGQAEDGYEPAVVLFNRANQFTDNKQQLRFSAKHLQGLAPAGRLDIDSQGLLVLTQDGRIAKTLIGENSPVEKEYLVRIEGQVTNDKIKELSHGLSLDGKLLKPAKISRLNQDQLKFILVEGRKRQIRRMCDLVDLKVTGLKRVRTGKIVLGKLPEGQWRYLGKNESFI